LSLTLLQVRSGQAWSRTQQLPLDTTTALGAGPQPEPGKDVVQHCCSVSWATVPDAHSCGLLVTYLQAWVGQ
jgi:hypothetical protein